MTLKTQMVTDFSTIFLDTDDFAEAITYFPRGKSKLSLNAQVFVDELIQVTAFDDGTAQEKRATVLLAASAVTAAKGDKILWNGTLWQVVAEPDLDGSGQQLQIKAIEPVDVAPGSPTIGR